MSDLNELPFMPERFLEAQQDIYDEVKKELAAGRKESHWMWFIFPQVLGLGLSPTSMYFAIPRLEVARSYLAHPVLGPRLVECTELILTLENRTAKEIFGFPDVLKLKSSLTLFRLTSEPGSVFARALDKYFDGELDGKTLERLREDDPGWDESVLS